jgi:hypothetical protein
MHSGLLRPGSVPDVGHAEVAQVVSDIAALHAFADAALKLLIECLEAQK